MASNTGTQKVQSLLRPLQAPSKKVPGVGGSDLALMFLNPAKQAQARDQARAPEGLQRLVCLTNIDLIQEMQRYMQRVFLKTRGMLDEETIAYREGKLSYAGGVIARIRSHPREITIAVASNFAGKKTSIRLRNVIARQFMRSFSLHAPRPLTDSPLSHSPAQAAWARQRWPWSKGEGKEAWVVLQNN
jgi:hypothetical protein